MPERWQRDINPGLKLLGLLCGLALLVIFSAGWGFVKIPAGDVLRIILAGFPGQEGWLTGLNETFVRIVMEVRLPRILTALAVGGGLALSGTVFQGLLLNPLADPYTLGVSAGAAFGAALSIIFSWTFFGIYTLPLMAFLGALATLAAVLALSTVDGQVSPNTLILSGVIVAAILSAGISFLKYLAGEQVGLIIFWLMGSLVARTWIDAAVTWPVVVVGLIFSFYFARDLNVLALGHRTADSLGVNTRRVRLILLITASLVTAVCVSVSGIIGFVGLIVPHLLRFLVGPDNVILLPASALGGAALLLLADTLTRTVLPHEVPIGVLTALIGGPYFCYLFRQKQLAGRHA